jgi:hypothetical protein
MSEEQGKRFRHDIKEMERRYLGWWNVNMMGNYCWTLRREIPENSHNRRSNIRSFAGKRKRQHKTIESNLTSNCGDLIVFNKCVCNCPSSSFIWTHFLTKYINPMYTYLKLLTMQILGKWYLIKKNWAQFWIHHPKKSVNLAKIFKNCKNAALCYERILEPLLLNAPIYIYFAYII